MDSKEKRRIDERTIQEYWEKTAVFTGAWNTDRSRPSRREQGAEYRKLTEDELLPGELLAVTFRVGCYIIRKAWRVYKIHGPGYFLELEMPADHVDVELVRKDLEPDDMPRTKHMLPSWSDRLRITDEISARHNDNPTSGFTYICRAAEDAGLRWCEKIGPIYTAKASVSIPDEYASLLVCLTFLGDSHTDDSWYRLDPTGKITIFKTNSHI